MEGTTMSDMRRMMMMFTRPVDSGGGGDDPTPPTPVLPYDAQVEYIESSGTQYIDTGINFRTVAVIELSLMITKTSSSATAIYGCWYDNSSVPRTQLYIQSGRWRGVSTTYSLTTGISNNATYNTSSQYNISISSRSAQASDATAYLFARNSDSGGYIPTDGMRVISAKMYSNNVLVRDFIPVRVGQIGYLYDRVSGELFDNSGTGSFTCGNDVTT